MSIIIVERLTRSPMVLNDDLISYLYKEKKKKKMEFRNWLKHPDGPKDQTKISTRKNWGHGKWVYLGTRGYVNSQVTIR